MTIEQQNLIDSLMKQAASTYDKMDEMQVDYDKFKQVADASKLKADQAQKIYDRLYKKFIYYPSFIKSLGKIKDDSKIVSDREQEILNKKYNSFYSYKIEYDNIISKINQTILKINAEDLAKDIQDLVDNPDSLTYSYELVNAADEYARKKAEAEISKDLITGREACIDKNGIEIDMSVCRPSNASSGGGSVRNSPPTASEILEKNINDWIEIVNIAVSEPMIVEKPIQKQPEPDPQQPEPVIQQPEPVPQQPETVPQQPELKTSLEDTIKSEIKEIESLLGFKVDISKITKDKLLSDKKAPSARQQNINYALCTSEKVTSIKERYVTIGSNSSNTLHYFYNKIGAIVDFQVNVNSANSKYLEIGKKVRINVDNRNIIYYIGEVISPYNPSNGVLKLKIIDYVGGGIYQHSNFIVEGIDIIEDVRIVINNPYSLHNGKDLSIYLKQTDTTEEELAIARASCPTSNFSAEYYKLASNKISFDGINNKKSKLMPLYYLIGGVSLFFIVKSILKKNK